MDWVSTDECLKLTEECKGKNGRVPLCNLNGKARPSGGTLHAAKSQVLEQRKPREGNGRDQSLRLARVTRGGVNKMSRYHARSDLS